MVLTYNRDQHKEYLNMADRIGLKWIDIFEGDVNFYSAVYWDLLAKTWKSDQPVRKTDALKFMTSVKSPHTAGKYVESAIEEGFLIETENPDDARSKLLMLSPEMRGKLDIFFDKAVSEIRQSSRTVEELGC